MAKSVNLLVILQRHDPIKKLTQINYSNESKESSPKFASNIKRIYFYSP